MRPCRKFAPPRTCCIRPCSMKPASLPPLVGLSRDLPAAAEFKSNAISRNEWSARPETVNSSCFGFCRKALPMFIAIPERRLQASGSNATPITSSLKWATTARAFQKTTCVASTPQSAAREWESPACANGCASWAAISKFVLSKTAQRSGSICPQRIPQPPPNRPLFLCPINLHWKRCGGADALSGTLFLLLRRHQDGGSNLIPHSLVVPTNREESASLPNHDTPCPGIARSMALLSQAGQSTQNPVLARIAPCSNLLPAT